MISDLTIAWKKEYSLKKILLHPNNDNFSPIILRSNGLSMLLTADIHEEFDFKLEEPIY